MRPSHGRFRAAGPLHRRRERGSGRMAVRGHRPQRDPRPLRARPHRPGPGRMGVHRSLPVVRERGGPDTLLRWDFRHEEVDPGRRRAPPVLRSGCRRNPGESGHHVLLQVLHVRSRRMAGRTSGRDPDQEALPRVHPQGCGEGFREDVLSEPTVLPVRWLFIWHPDSAGQVRLMVETDTRFEKARIIGARALQISCGAPAFTDVETARMLDPIDIAEAEYDSGLIPISVIRK